MREFEQFKSLLEIMDVKAQSRVTEHEDDAKLRRFKDKWLFMMTMIVILFSFAGWILFIAMRPDSPHLALVLNGGFGLVMGLCGYYVRAKTS
jgi:hypothetical protein